MPNRVCEHCGADRWKARDAERVYSRLQQKTRDADRLARENGLLTYKLRDAEAAASDTQALLQRKITRQARVIRRMEDRLKGSGQAPYSGAQTTEQTAPGAEYDADLRLPGEDLA